MHGDDESGAGGLCSRRAKLKHDIMQSANRFEASLFVISQAVETGDMEKIRMICSMLREEPGVLKNLVKDFLSGNTADD